MSQAAPRSLPPLLMSLAVGLLGMASVLGVSSRAHALGCGSRLVELGDPSVRVRDACGEPNYVTTRTETRSAWSAAGGVGYGFGYGYGSSVTVQVEVWVYDFGPTRFIEELTFENGILRLDRTLGYGTTEGRRHRDAVRREAHRDERRARSDDDD